MGGAPIITLQQYACTWQQRGISPLLQSLLLLLMPPLPCSTGVGSSTLLAWGSLALLATSTLDAPAQPLIRSTVPPPARACKPPGMQS